MQMRKKSSPKAEIILKFYFSLFIFLFVIYVFTFCSLKSNFFFLAHKRQCSDFSPNSYCLTFLQEDFSPKLVNSKFLFFRTWCRTFRSSCNKQWKPKRSNFAMGSSKDWRRRSNCKFTGRKS